MAKEDYLIVDDEAIVELLYNSLEVAHEFDCQCAWCLKEAKRDLGNGSHGICAHHREEVYATFKASR